MIKLTVQSERARALLGRLAAGLTPDAMDPTVAGVAARVLGLAIAGSPRRWFGQIQSGWVLQKLGPGSHAVTIPPNKQGIGGTSVADIARFVDQGTANDGADYIYPKRAKKLYIPLTRRAAAGWNPGLTRGEDYILVDRVRGIKGRHFIDPIRRQAADLLRAGMLAYVRALIRGGGNG